MKRLLVLVEGYTEQTFFNQTLVSHLAMFSIEATCTMIATSREQGRRAHRGGHAHNWSYIENDLRILLRSNPDAVSTMLDLYGFPKNMPGFPTQLPTGALKRAQVLGTALAAVIGDPRFIPGILVHEFEGLLFSAPTKIAETCVPTKDQVKLTRALQKIRDSHSTPEDIDNGPTTAPSKQIEALVPTYAKRRHGPIIAQTIGLAGIRLECKVFDEWLQCLEALAPKKMSEDSEELPKT
jgi:Domain of unknown function (DUF4276)